MRLALKVAILASGRTQRRVGFECGIPESGLSEIVRGWAEPTEHERHAIAEALGRRADELFGPGESAGHTAQPAPEGGR